jgi:hypothetical protein
VDPIRWISVMIAVEKIWVLYCMPTEQECSESSKIVTVLRVTSRLRLNALVVSSYIAVLEYALPSLSRS